ncbi:MAG: DNA topoisomerase VI subunit B [Promethearchaeota archaeon]
MRKRTQLVGFEFGYWKHVQYCAEFIDNALDAIESFQWKEKQKPDSKIKFSLDQELFLEKFSVLETAKEEKKSQHLNNEAKQTLMQELGINSIEPIQPYIQEPEEKEEESGEIIDKEELEIEEEVRRIIDDMQEMIKPVEYIIDVEPIVGVRIREFEAQSFLTSEISQKNIMSYTFEIFDNGTGMSKIDLRKFGRYLASSKSMELKQTRGSQGFGAPSAFSDAQNTTGKPIITVSKSADNVYATVTEFFTTSKNEKKYLIHPTDIDSFFLHGTYIKLNYLNVKYVKGYVEKYIEETAFMNPHVTIIYIDPDGKEKIYRRLAISFPDEPKYAKPHPSSVNIGDLQDLITKSENKSISAFLQDNFVRMSSKTAKDIVEIAEADLQDRLNLLILEDGFVNLSQKKTDAINFMTYEKRVFGRSDKPRDKLIIYQVESEDLKESYWNLISNYNKFNKDHEKINKEIKKLNNRIEKTETQKEIKNIEKEIKTLLEKIDDIRKQKDKLKLDLNKLFKNSQEGLVELKKLKNRTDFEDLLNQVLISKVKPSELTKEMFNSLFLAFKSIKYMAPPTDTAIPVGEATLENTLIKEIGLKISENVDDFGATINNINQTYELLSEDKKKTLLSEGIKVDDDAIANILVDPKEVINLSSEILGTVEVVDEAIDQQQVTQYVNDLLIYSDIDTIDTYQGVFEYFIENYTKDDDFVAAETRAPTSGKGLAYVVEAVMAYSRNLEVPKRSRDVLSRFVNRTPKLRDSADCAITKAVQSVNWKNYNLDTYDNGLPKGPIKLLVNVSGPFVHLMFKSQSKNALADDEDLIKEIKYCLEAIGRRLRIYLNRKASLHKSEKRASLIEKYIPLFVNSLYNIASQGESIHKANLNKMELEDLMRNAIGKKPAPVIKPPEVKEIKEPIVKEEQLIEKPAELKPDVEKVEPKKELFTEKTLKNWTKKELIEYCKEHEINLLSKDTKTVIIDKIIESYKKPIEAKPVELKTPEPIEVIPDILPAKQVQLPISKAKIQSKVTPKKIPTIHKPKTPKKTQITLPIITTEKILDVLSNEWQTIKHLIFKLKIKDMMDARYLQHQLKKLEREDKVLVESKMGKRQWKLK